MLYLYQENKAADIKGESKMNMKDYYQVGDIEKTQFRNMSDDEVIGFNGSDVVVRGVKTGRIRSHCTVPGICGVETRIIRNGKELVFVNGKTA